MQNDEHEKYTSCTKYQHASLRGLRFNIRQDINRYLTKSEFNKALGKGLKRKLSAFFMPEIQCLSLYRLSHYLYINGWKYLAQIIARLNQIIYKVNITPQSCIGPACRLSHPPGVVFHGSAGKRLTLFSLAVCYASTSSADAKIDVCPKLGNNVQLGAYTSISGPITIGDGVKIFPMLQTKQDIAKNKTLLRRKLKYKVSSI
jgi:serine O-acetyltransferase